MSNKDVKTLLRSMNYITKLSYMDNITGYMKNFTTFIKKHTVGLKEGKYPEYHKDTKIAKNDKFSFKVYRMKKDPDGNIVTANKTLNKGRTVYHVKKVQV